MKTSAFTLTLAPMAGVGDRAFREICRELGADAVTTEMISAKAFSFHDRKTLALAEVSPGEAPVSLQLFGHEPEIVAEAAAYFSRLGVYRAIDLNFGCPVHKITAAGDGSALLKDPALLYEIAARCADRSAVPVTAKIRVGWDREHINAGEIARLLEKAGVSSIAVHGRTKADLYRPGTVDENAIKEAVEAVSIPVFANGDIKDGESAEKMLKNTGAAGLMIGRAALGAPWIFSEIRAALEKKEAPVIDRADWMRRHVKMAFLYKPHAAGAELRTHFAHYLKGFHGAARLREAVSCASSLEDYFTLIDSIR